MACRTSVIANVHGDSKSPLIVPAVSFLQRPPEENHCRAQHQDGRGLRHRLQADYARRLISDESEVVGPGQRLERKIARRLVRRWHKIEGDLKPGARSPGWDSAVDLN